MNDATSRIGEPRDPLVGLTLGDRYRIIRRVARGGMATVYEAIDTTLERTVAVKVLHPHLAEDPGFRAKFTREAQAAARLSDANVVSVHDQGTTGEISYLVMEYVQGRTLRALLRRNGRLSPEVALDTTIQLLSGLAAAHRAGLIHRDLKPENILISDEGRVKIADFGLARAVSNATNQASALIGTVTYLSPELLSRGRADERSDIYAVGIILFEMLTGRAPFVGEEAAHVAYQHAHATVPLPSSIADDVPVELDDLVVWTTRRDPEDRPHDAGELLEQTIRVRTELGFPQTTGRSLGAALNAAPEPDSADATAVIVPTTVAPTGLAPTAPEPAPDQTGGATDSDGSTPSSALTSLRHSSRRRRGRTMLLGIIAVAVVVGAGLAGWFLGDGPGAVITVPDMSSSSPDNAQQTLAQLGFAVDSREENSLNVPSGTVIGTDPSAGSGLHRGDPITVVVSIGPRIVALPDVVGAALDTAKQSIEGAGLVIDETVPELFDKAVPAGSVISVTDGNGQRLDGGAQLPEQSTVRLTTSLGAIPSVTGLSQDDAMARLQDAGLKVAVTQAFSGSVAAGTVISQASEKQSMAKGNTVTLTVSKGPEMVTIPDLAGKTLNDARRALEAVGLEATSNFPDQSIPLLGVGYWDYIRVESTDPSAGAQVPKGGTVNLKGTFRG